MDRETFQALRRIVIYLSPEEARHFLESGKPQQHIYRDVLKLAAYTD